MLVGDGFHQAFVAYGLVHRLQRIAVFQSDFHLARRVFGDRRACWNVVEFARRIQVGEERFDLLQLAQAIDLRVSRSTAVSVQRRLRATVVIALGVEQIELQLAGHYRVITLGLQAVDHADQQVTRVGDARRHSLLRVHAYLHGGGRNLPPRQPHQTAFERVGAAVDIAHIPDQPGVLDVIALQGQAEDGAGQRTAAFIHRQQLFAMQQLAARHAVGIEDEQLDHVDIRVVRQKSLGVFKGCEFHCSSLTLASCGRTDSGLGTTTDAKIRGMQAKD
ncbi:hypothetical protein D3C85_1101530 [compost metagenome]